jgi:tetratricopeptide (TPR) repeat protein
LILLAYTPVLWAGFVWDDDLHLLNNVVLQADGLYRVWFTGESPNYWPLTWSTYWLEHQLWGLDPRGYHVVNVAVHAANALLVWRVLLRLRIPGAWLAALIFGLHPLNVESAAWISQRKNTLSLLFYLSALALFLRHEHGRSRAVYTGAVLAFLLSMLSKGAGVTLPVALLLLAWWQRGRITREDFRLALPFFGIAAIMSGFEIGFQYINALGLHDVRDDSLLARVAGAGWAIWFYLGKTALPLGLSFVYPRWEIDPTAPFAWLPDLALLTLGAICWHQRGGWGRHAGVALIYFVVTLAPVLGFFQFYYLRYSFVGDHYVYVAILGPIAWAAGVTCHAASGLGGWQPRGAQLAAGAVLASLFALTWQSSGRFVDAETLLRDTLTKNPGSWMVHHNLAGELRLQGRDVEAIPHYQEAIRLQPDIPQPHRNLALILLGQGLEQEAEQHLLRAVEIAPTFYGAHRDLATLHWQRDERDEALPHYQALVRISPKQAASHALLANAYAEIGRRELAERHYRRAVQLEPTHMTSLLGLARLFSSCTGTLRPHREASRFAERALLLPGGRTPRALSTLAAAYAAEGRYPEASAAARRGLGIADPAKSPALVEQLRAQLAAYGRGQRHCEELAPK